MPLRQKLTSDQIKERIRKYGTKYDIDENYLNSFQSALKDYSTGLADRYDSVQYNGYADSIGAEQSKIKDLQRQSRYIRAWINSGGSAYENPNEMLKALDETDTMLGEGYKAFDSKYKYFSQFETEDDYNIAQNLGKLTSADIIKLQEEMRGDHTNGNASASGKNSALSPMGKAAKAATDSFERHMKKMQEKYSLKDQTSEEETALKSSYSDKYGKYGFSWDTYDSDYAMLDSLYRQKQLAEIIADTPENILNGDIDRDATISALRTWDEPVSRFEDFTNKELAALLYAKNNGKLGYITDPNEAGANYSPLIRDIAEQRGTPFYDAVNNTLLEPVFGAVKGFGDFPVGVLNSVGSILGATPLPEKSIDRVYQKMQGDNTGLWKVVNDAVYTGGNMLPSILIGKWGAGKFGQIAGQGGNIPTTGMSKFVAENIGVASLGASAAGNAYSEMINLGYDKSQARNYGLLVGASEALLEKFLGGINFGAGKGGIASATVNTFIKKIDNAIGRAAIALGANMVDEGIEEAVQTALEPYFKAFATGEDVENADWDEILYSALLGALMGGVFEGLSALGDAVSGARVNSAVNNVMRARYSTPESRAKLLDNVLEMDESNKLASRLKEKTDGGQKRISVKNLKKLEIQGNKLFSEKLNRELSKSIPERLVELGADEATAAQVAPVILKKLQGETLTAGEEAIFDDSEVADLVYNETFEAISDATSVENVTDGKTVVDGENAAQSENTGTSEPTVESLSKKYGVQAKAYVGVYNLNSGQDVDRFDSAFALAYDMGKSGVPFDYVKKSAGIGNDLTDTQKELAYNAGKEASDVEARNNYLRNVLQSKKKGGTINENNTNGGINNAEQRTEENAGRETQGARELGGISQESSGARETNGDGSRIQETVGEKNGNVQKDNTVQRLSGGLKDSSWILDPKNYIVPERNSDLHKAEKTLTEEYGIECHIVKASEWKIKSEAVASPEGKVYISEGVNSEDLKAIPYHEATHVMRMLNFKPYLEFIESTPDKLNIKANECTDLMNYVAEHLGYDIFSMNSKQYTRFYDELNAAVYGWAVCGIDESIKNAFNDFDAYINELSAIHEQFKKENTSARPEGKRAVRRRGFVKSEGVKLSELKKAFNDTQNKAYKILDTIARVTGINIVLYKSDVDADGNFIGKQGKFKWSNDTIYIDINAGLENKYDVGDLAKYTMLRTFSHEFSHFIEKWNPIQYNELRRAIFSELTARGADVDELITNKLAEDSTGEMTYEEASREVVAEALTDILPDSSFIETLANKHKNVFNKLLSKLKEFIADIKAYFKDLAKNKSDEANKLKEEMNGALHYAESIVKLFDKAAVDAVENYQAATPKADTDGKVQNQERYTKAPIFDVHATLDSVMDKVSAEDIAAGIKKAKNEYKVTDDEYFSVESYVRGRAYDLTRLQRAGETAEWGEMETYLTDNIKSGLLKHPTYSGRTYRNLDFGTVFNTETDYEDFIRENAAGNEVTLKAFTSASKNPNGYPVVGDKVVHLVIDSLSARDISETFGLGQEEVIYLPGTKYKVTKVTTANDGHILIYGEEIATNEVQKLSGGTEGPGLYRSHEAVSEGHRNDTRRVEYIGRSSESSSGSGEIQNERSDGVYGETFGGLYEEINKTKITAGMSDSKRAEILKNKVINAPMYEGQADSLIAENESKLESKKIEFAREAILKIADKLDILGKQINFKDVEVQIQLSKSNLKESVVKDATPKQIAKLLPILSKTAENAVVIERHNNRYYYDTDTVYFDNLLSGYVDGDYLVPVRFGLKHSRTGTTTLYVLVDQNKVALKDLGNIKKDDRGPQDASPDLTESDSLHRSVTYSISQIIPFVNSKDLLRYVPDDFLNTEQLKAKREAVAETEKYTDEKNDKKYSAYVEKGLNDTAKQMLSSKAKAEGYEKINAEEVYNSAEDRVKLTDVTYDDEGNLIPISKRYDSSDPDERYQERIGSLTDREILELAADKIDANELTPAEKDALKIFKKRLSKLKELQDKRAELGKLYKEQQFGKDGKKPNRDEAIKTFNRMHIFDEQIKRAMASVVSVEDKAVLTNVFQKARKIIEEERKQHYKEIRKRYFERKNKTEYRHKIFRVVNELNQLLTKNTKDKHIPSALKVPVAAALDAVNMDTVGAEERIAKKQAELEKARLNKNDKRIAELEREIEYIEKINDRMSEKLATLKAAYDSILKSSDPLIKESYDEVISDAIDKVMGLVGDTPIRDMSLSQLEAVYNMYRMILKRVRDANKAFLASKTESITELAEGAMTELDAQKQRDKYVGKIRDLVNSFDWNNQKPIYAFLRLKSPTLLRLYNNVRHGEDVWALDISEAAKFFDDCKKKYGYKKWDLKKTYSFTSTTGKEFKLSLDQIMSVYALSKRKQADDHLRIGGFVFDETTEVKGEHGKTFKLKDSTAYKLNKEKVAEIVGALTEEQIAFVDETQAYLSDVMAEKGNEITRAMYDVELFGEKNYFPLRVAGQYLERKRDQANGDVKIKNKGFSKETTPNANAPVVLSSFSDVWAEHVNEMSMYHAFVLPLEDFYRVYNYQTVRSETSDLHGVIPSIDSAHGNGASKYIDQLLKDINGGAVTDPRETFAKRTISNFKKAAVMASMSVVVQQPTSIVRAMAIVDPKYFAKIQKLPKNKHKAKWEELKKYAPVAIIKEIGSFDTGTGRGAVEWIKGEKTFFNKADDFISRAPAYADEVTWCAIWDAVKRETLSKNQSLSPTSEEFLKIAGERFTEVITMTQVYDSTLSRSAYMRSKSVYTAMLTSFMAESTTSLNMLEYGVINKKARARMWSAAYGSILFNAVVVSFVYAMRDDDEDETFMEKYLSRLASEAVDGINPLTMMPFVKDIWSVFQGYDVERADMSLITDLAQSLERFTRALLSGKNIVSSISDLLGSVSSMFGVPLRNVTRDIKAIINAFLTSWEIPDGSDIGVGVYNSVKSQIPIWNYFPDIKK